MKTSTILNSFASGELSPYLDGRTDVERYYSGVKTLENFINLPYGGAKRRPGTYYVSEVKDSDRKTRLVPFQFSITQAYIIEFGDRYCRFYANQGQLLSSGSAYEIASPYLEADLFDLQFAQDADTMWITHPSYKPRKLTRNALTWNTNIKMMLHLNGTDGSTTITDETSTHTPAAQGTAQIDTAQYVFGGASLLLDGDSDYLTVADHADFSFGVGSFSIGCRVKFVDKTGTQFLFSQFVDGTHYWNVYKDAAHKIVMNFVDGTAKGTYTMTSAWNGLADDTWYTLLFVRNITTGLIFIDGVSQILTVSTAFGTNNVGSLAADLWIGAYESGPANYFDGWIDELILVKGEALQTADYTVPTTAYAPDVITFAIANYAPELLTLDVAPGGAWSAGETVTGNTSGSTCVIVEVLTTKTYRVKDRDAAYTLGEVLTNGTDTADQGVAHPTTTGDPFGADDSDDCPTCVSIFEQRIHFANINNAPQKSWVSVSGDYEDMTVGVNAGDAFTYTIGSEQVNAIRWFSSGKFLAMGTFGGVFSLSSGNDEVAITPTNITIKREITYGSLGVTPKKMGDSLFYVQRNSKIVREFIGKSFMSSDNKYIESAFDATVLAEHITGDGIVEMAYQQSPYNILWCVRSDGELACLTRQVNQDVLAWSRQILGGSFGAGNAVVETVAVIPGDGANDEVWIIVKRTINGSTVRYIEYFKPMDYGSEQEDAFFVDSGLTLDSPKPITAITKATTGVMTATGHGFSNGDIVIVRGVLGMTEVNRTKYKVAGVSGDTFQLNTTATVGVAVNTTAYTTYVSGGEVRKCSTSVTGLTHLVAETVDLFIDGDTATTAVVTAGGVAAITTPANGGGEIHAGLRFTPYLKPMRIEAGSGMDTAQGKLKRINKIVVRVHESLKMKAGNTDTQDEFDFLPKSGSSGDFIETFSGDQQILQPSAWDRDGYVVITQAGPYPLNILAIIIHLTTSDYD